MEEATVNLWASDLVLRYSPLMQAILAGVAVLVEADQKKVDKALDISMKVLVEAFQKIPELQEELKSLQSKG